LPWEAMAMGVMKRPGPLARLTFSFGAWVSGLNVLAVKLLGRGRKEATVSENPHGTAEDARTDERHADPGSDGTFANMPDIPIPDEAEGLNALGTSTSDSFGYLCTFGLRRNAEEAGDYYRRVFRLRCFEYAEYSDGSSVRIGSNGDPDLRVQEINSLDRVQKGLSLRREVLSATWNVHKPMAGFGGFHSPLAFLVAV